MLEKNHRNIREIACNIEYDGRYDLAQMFFWGIQGTRYKFPRE